MITMAFETAVDEVTVAVRRLLEGLTTGPGDGLGCDRTVWSYPGATFLGAGGYHHLGANTWAGPHACPAGAQDARLLARKIVLPNATDVCSVAANPHDHPQAATDA